ncbi:SusC/RagA family TonB-linked outer membrane protein [Neotamlana laminarinivorans]|uniref:TonB-dependent receptor n=1 Tax=Neotamlana laminarinivorans TaxID=2883124 RepID=A0A9X1L0S7_9FLAO|nr:TonB-dependent receptor [Tamlana laminarinivorans]MCB4797910.1 TonB-dependent receptor [Tamlana laminarinivorans]
MKVKLTSRFFSQRKKLLLTINSLVILGFSSTNAVSASTVNTYITIQQSQISGVVYDSNGLPLAGATVIEKGTTNGAQTDFDGTFSLNLTNPNPTLVISYVGFTTKEITIGDKTNVTITLQEDVSQLDEVVVVGYGTQKKVNLTASVSQVGAEVFENRPTANAFRSLQGTVPGLVISNSASGGEPGAASNINIRGFITANSDGTDAGSLADAGPLVLIDGVEMSLNDIDPEDIESVSVLKDAAAASIYGSRAAGGAVLVTTKSGKNTEGKIRVNVSSSFSLTQPSIWPESASPIDFAYTMNDARINNNQAAYYDETELGYIIANMQNPGSAPSIQSNAAGTDWDYGTIGIEGTGATNWDDIIMKNWAQRTKHNLSLSGGTEKLNFYLSAGAYDEDGLLAVGDESYQRYNLDAKFGSKVNDWLTIELLTKYRKSFTDFPTESSTNSTFWNKSRVLDLITKIKPTLPQYDPIYGSDRLQHSYYSFWDTQRVKTKNDQIILLPRIIIEPLDGLKFNVNLNYKRDTNFQETSILASQKITPAGFVDQIAQAATSYDSATIFNDYFSSNIFATYDKSVNNHNFHATIGMQTEQNKYYALSGSSDYLITNNIVSHAASLDDDQTLNESITHWSNVGLFSRFRYNYMEKYLFEVSYRRDGSSRFEPDNRWAGFPSYSVGYNIAKENFWPIDAVNTFKLRGSYGNLGNQNVGNYLYLTTIPLNTAGTSYLFGGERLTFANTPVIDSENLTWETVETTDIGFDLGAFNNRLNVGFSWYRTNILDMAAQGADLPAQLGTTAPLTNIGSSRIQGWEVEATWRQQLGDFGYSIRGVLSDYKRTITSYPNDTNNLSQYYAGRDLGDIWGYKTEGLFLTDEAATEVTSNIDYSFLTGWARVAGDIEYTDLNGDGAINNGNNVLGDSGDYTVIGNSTPRYQYSVTLAMNYKNWDFNALVQGVGKRQVSFANQQRFKGPANGPFHAFVWEGHLDYFRPEDTTSPLGPNTDAYFPTPYLNGGGRNNKNYNVHTDRLLQNAAYTRLKSVQLGYTIPREVTRKFKVDKIRLYATGENLLTFTDLMFFDPEVNTTGLTGSAQSYPLSRILSTGVNISF